MKPRILFSLILVFAVLFYLFGGNFASFKESSAEKSMLLPPSPGGSLDKFLYGAHQSYQDRVNNYANYDELGFNLWHSYVAMDSGVIANRHTPRGDLSSNDRLLNNVSEYADSLRQYIDILYLHNGSRLLWHRPKIEWLCYGQRSDYQCERDHLFGDSEFYSFRTLGHVGGVDSQDIPYGGGDWVRYFRSQNSTNGGNWVDNAGIVLSKLRTNSEQCKKFGTINQWQNDNECMWLIKPRIRADKNYIDNHSDEPVCRIDVYNQRGIKFKEVILRARNFKDQNNLYDGYYHEEFNFDVNVRHDSTLTYTGDWCGSDTSLWLHNARGNRADDYNDHWFNHADIQVYWYGNCDMWIDYVRVDNDVADQIFKGYYDDPLHPDNQWIKNEVEQIANHVPSGASDPAVLGFYMEYFEFNNIPCMAYVNQRIKQYSGNKIGLVADWYNWYSAHLPYTEMGTIMSAQQIYNNYVSRVGLLHFLIENYPLRTNTNGDRGIPDNCFCYIPNTLPVYTCSNNGVIAKSTDPGTYENWFQDNLDYIPYYYSTNHSLWENDKAYQAKGGFRWVMNLADSVTKLGNIPFIYLAQVHLNADYPIEAEREPTNEELDMLANIPITYGAKGITYFWMPSSDTQGFNPPYNRGILDPGNSIRNYNVYQQTKYKWLAIKDIGTRLKKWEPYIMSFDNTNRHSYIYYIDYSTVNATTIFSDIQTFMPEISDPDIPVTPGEMYPNRYLQVATFQPINTNPKYFMLVNRRCSPVKSNNADGRRLVKVSFNASNLQTYTSWKIINLGNDSTVASFAKTGNPYISLGWYMPGEGKLYKMIPVATGGGTLQDDEIISEVEFNCEGTVYNNGYNFTIGNNTTVHFTDTSQIVMNGGTFQMGDSSYHSSPNVTANAVSGNSWHGLSLTNCTVKIYNTTFSNIKNDTSYALNIIDCHTVDIRNSVFNSENGDLKGGINFTYFYQTGMPPNAYIGGNTFNWDKSKVPAINIMSDAGTIMPVIIENNTLNSSSTTGSTAIMLSGISGGAVKSNYINNFDKSITALSSSIDIAENTISSDIISSIGINTGSGTEIRLNNVGAEILGGMNNISNTDSNSINIKVDNSYFLIDNGQNIFNLGVGLPSYHLKGYFPAGYSYGLQETQNCFKVNNAVYEPPIDSITIGEGGDQPSFNFEPYLTGCTMGDFGQQMIVNLGDGIYDTIDTRNGGGGEPGIFILTPKTLYDSISIQMRYRNYNYVETKSTELINTYPDSIQSLNSISKLYLSTTATDTTQAGMSALKTFYENLILNHTYNTALVKRCNYYVQKCKVKLKQYSSALAGFQQIINENPYSYEGLVARWDYMATHLLDSLGGGGGERAYGDTPLRESIDDVENDNNNDPHDKSPWTKEQKKVIKTAINTSLEDSRISDERKIEGLTQLANSGSVDAAVKLKVMKTLKEVIKTQAPKTIIEHIKIVNNDIQKVFGNPNSKSKNKGSNLPTVFYLSQNYPNPFNPTTKINFELPKDVKVKIMVYDVLGREVIKLVDEFKKAGRYTVEFNGNNYASGVYFYRIEAGEFILAKKMVLIK